MQSFILPIVRASELSYHLARIDSQKLLEDRKRFHNLEAMTLDDRPKCSYCDRPLQIITDPAIGVEYACNNRECPGNNN